ncbi:hypothetical protein F5141DRAFT_1065722 [Pisolithus sp. B1]|nr:hypothetical protein F5141DRAFT_1065722 [Pisolithus sp. B1]
MAERVVKLGEMGPESEEEEWELREKDAKPLDSSLDLHCTKWLKELHVTAGLMPSSVVSQSITPEFTVIPAQKQVPVKMTVLLEENMELGSWNKLSAIGNLFAVTICDESAQCVGTVTWCSEWVIHFYHNNHNNKNNNSSSVEVVITVHAADQPMIPESTLFDDDSSQMDMASMGLTLDDAAGRSGDVRHPTFQEQQCILQQQYEDLHHMALKGVMQDFQAQKDALGEMETVLQKRDIELASLCAEIELEEFQRQLELKLQSQMEKMSTTWAANLETHVQEEVTRLRESLQVCRVLK